MIDHPLWETQVALERDSLQAWNVKQRNIFNSTSFNRSIPGLTLTRKILAGFSAAIQVFLDDSLRSGKPGVRAGAAVLMDELSADTLAFIATQVILVLLPRTDRNGGTNLTSFGMTIGDRVQDEVRARRFENENPEWFRSIMRDFDRKSLTRVKREEYMRRVLKETEEGWRIWSPNETLRVGLKLIELFNSRTGALIIRRGGKSEGFKNRVIPSPDYLGALSSLINVLTEKARGRPLMVIPPAPWSLENFDHGLSVSHYVRPTCLVKSASRAQKAAVRRAIADGSASSMLTAVNAVTATPWRVNRRVLDVVEWAYNNDLQIGSLPPSEHKVPDEPEFDWDSVDRTSDEFKDHIRYRAGIHRANSTVIATRSHALLTLAHARQYSSYEEFYFTHSLDTRGRAYADFPTLTPQGTDYTKALLQFARGKPLGNRGVYWLGVHGANCFGFDKAHPDERAQWAVDYGAMIAECADDPYTNRWWTEADEPFQFLAFCFEYAGCTPETISHLPVAQDATCSGLQHFSALLRDPVGGFYVNLTDDPQRQDVYLEVAKQAQGELKGMGGLHASTWLSRGLMDRSVAKHPVMIKPYSGTRDGCRQYVSEAIRTKIKEGLLPPADEAGMWDFIQTGTTALWAAIPKIVVAADVAMAWLGEMASLCGKHGTKDSAVKWVTPSGFPAQVRKMKMRGAQIKTVFEGATFMPQLTSETPKMDPRRLRNSVPPGFIASMDAAHMHLTTEAAVEEGLQDFAMIHDSFGVHAADVDQFSRIIRQQFLRMYTENDVLAQFEDSVREQINPEFQGQFPERPPLGTLDLRGVLKNPYFFS